MASKRKIPHRQQPPISPLLSKRKIESATNRRAVAQFFTPISQREPDKLTWSIVNHSLLVGRYKPSTASSVQTSSNGNSVKNGNENSTASRQGLSDGSSVNRRRKIAAFDFDGTLIRTSSGNAFGKDAADWAWWHPTIPKRLRQLYDDGYLVTILSNQAGISLHSDPKSPKSQTKRLADFKSKVGYVLAQLDIPLTLYAATAKDRFRKPAPGMWQELLEEADLDIYHDMAECGPDLKACFFVGDAAGRTARAHLKADHSASDRNFAVNIGIDFHTPEEFFLDELSAPFVRAFDPAAYTSIERTEHTAAATVFTKTNPVDLVVLCGSPGSGKSSFFWRHLQPLGYERVNQDILKTRDKCLQRADEHLRAGLSVAVDNTNPNKDTRRPWIQLAQQHQVPIRCVCLNTPPEVCQHNDVVRALHADVNHQDTSTNRQLPQAKQKALDEVLPRKTTSASQTIAPAPGLNPESRTMLPTIAFTSFAKRHEPPTLDEGFQDIVEIPFVFQGNEDQRRIWSQYWF